MPEQTYTQVVATLSAKSFQPAQLSTVYLIVGSDDLLKREIASLLLRHALDAEFADFDSETIDLGPGAAAPDGEGDPSTRILSAAAMAPFMSPRKVVTVTSAQRLTKERQADLADGVKRLGARTLLILVADAPEWEAGRPKGKQIEAALKKAVAAMGVVVTCDAPQPSDLKARARALFEGWGVQAEAGVIDALAEHAAAVSANAGSGAVATLTRECEKLRSYVGERAAVTLADIGELVPNVAQENIFRLLDAVGLRDTRQALAMTDALLAAGDKPDAVMARTLVMLQRHVRLLMLAKYTADRKLTARGAAIPDSVKEILTGELSSMLLGQAYRMPGYVKQAAKFDWAELVWATSRILAADLAMKGIAAPAALGASSPAPGDDPASALRLLVTQLCAGVK